VKVDSSDPGWRLNGLNRFVSHKYGYGKMDATALVNASRTFPLLPKGAQVSFPKVQVNSEIPLGIQPLLLHFSVSEEEAKTVGKVEKVKVTVSVRHPRRGSLSMKLTSPLGTESIIALERPFDNSKDGLKDWSFITVHCWGETAYGCWNLSVFDSRPENNPETKTPLERGVFISWSLQIYGTCSNADMLFNEHGEAYCPKAAEKEFPMGSFLLACLVVANVAVVLLLMCMCKRFKVIRDARRYDKMVDHEQHDYIDIETVVTSKTTADPSKQGAKNAFRPAIQASAPTADKAEAVTLSRGMVKSLSIDNLLERKAVSRRELHLSEHEMDELYATPVIDAPTLLTTRSNPMLDDSTYSPSTDSPTSPEHVIQVEDHLISKQGTHKSNRHLAKYFFGGKGFTKSLSSSSLFTKSKGGKKESRFKV
jgi:subtilisin-like proprotein convertase family protein